MGGASGAAAPVADDSRIKPGERLWRLIEIGWYQPGLQSTRSVQEAAFIGEVSLLREALVNERIVDAVKNGKFAKYGIAQLNADEIRGQAGCFLRITADADWPADAHVLIIRKSGGKNLRITHPEVLALTMLANSKSLVREPQP